MTLTTADSSAAPRPRADAALAQKSDAPMPVTSSVQQVLRAASALGLGAAELSAVVSVMLPERRAAFARTVGQ